jgi:hypothetical protein
MLNIMTKWLNLSLCSSQCASLIIAFIVLVSTMAKLVELSLPTNLNHVEHVRRLVLGVGMTSCFWYYNLFENIGSQIE